GAGHRRARAALNAAAREDRTAVELQVDPPARAAALGHGRADPFLHGREVVRPARRAHRVPGVLRRLDAVAAGRVAAADAKSAVEDPGARTRRVVEAGHGPVEEDAAVRLERRERVAI